MTVPAPARQAVAAFVRDRAAALDAAATDTRADLAELGGHDLLATALGDTDIREFARLIEDVAAESLAAGFSLWAQRMTLEYVWRAPDPVRSQYLGELASGRTAGVTAMAAALKHLAGLGELPLRAEADDGRAVSGPIAWASNVFDDALIVFPYRGHDGSGRVAVVAAAADGVRVRPAPELLALGATGSTALTFDRVEVPDDHLITTDLPVFAAAVRPIFLLLQTAFCSGIAGRSVAEAGALLDGLGAQFRGEYTDLAARHGSVRQRLYEFAADTGRVPPADLIRVRLDASRTAVAATRLESTLRGGAGFARGCDTNRRFREAAFLPVQSPSEGQLRWELSQYD
ncbi:acyl-CoA dehydrogenase family protein [Nocardia violaceofusca]|uniref:acyl-CoA dehydrogenase family protein n=1 Tax=Nocardia violaceofusca TaxID=941182 RepID=UPI0007A3C20F|nr:acyl-CoA dehydrogenase family protein [Nocardia violaceofusca]